MDYAQSAVSHPQSVRPKWLALAAVAVLLGLVLRAAWVTEDAYITLRTVDNWVHGYGLRWNVDERVQGYTHPLWMFALSAVYWITREGYASAVSLGVLTTLAALLGLIRCARSAGHAVAAVTLLALSRAFVEFSTSGLENPLSHFLVALFVWLYALRGASLRMLTLAGALLALNRIDALIIAIPALLHASWQSYRAQGAKHTAQQVLAGAWPYLAWEAFSFFYYGFLFPNTAYAKLNTGLPAREVARQGLAYVLNALAWDPPLLIVIGLALGVAVVQRRTHDRMLALGVALYVAYVIAIGGDFMLGRFLTLPLFLAVCIIAISLLPLEEPTRMAAVLFPFLLLYWHPSATDRYPIGDFHHDGVADERAYYHDQSTLMMFTRTRGLPNHGWAVEGNAARSRREQVRVAENVGLFGFYAGPTLHIIDPLALIDPLLARLPARYDPNWRVGHYRRMVPPGYVETVRSGQCQMTDRSLCRYYAKLKEVIAGPLWSWSRLKTLFALNFGRYDDLIDRERYMYPELQSVTLQALSVPVADASLWNGPGTRMFSSDGIEIAIDHISRASWIDLTLDGNDDYELEFRNGGTLQGRVLSPSLDLPYIHSRGLSVPKHARKDGFDRILIRPARGDGAYSVAYVRLK